MFAIIKTNGATEIAIHIPHQGSEKTLPALAAMLEQNAVFINSGYSTLSTVKPTMSITLGDKFLSDNSDTEIVVASAGAVIGEDFVLATPEVFTSNAKGLKRERDENSRLRTENSFLKSELERIKGQLEELTRDSETA